MDYHKHKILILGANVTECFIIERAKALGLYTIVTDNNSDPIDSPAKEIADEAWNISWSDIDALTKKSKETGVDGVIAGFSEFRVENQIALSNRLGLPCNITLEQLAITRDKRQFKAACKKAGLPIVPEYSAEEAFSHLPVIVKPVDRAGSIGINIAQNATELTEACNIATEASPTNHIIIEKYMTGCMKFDAYYIVQEGKALLIATNDTLMCPPEKNHEILQSAWVFPSKYHHLWLQKHHHALEKFIHDLNFRNGYLTLSAFVDSNGNFFIFETGFRLSGELSFKFSEHAFGFNYIDNLIAFSIEGIWPKLSCTEPIDTNPLLVINHFAKDGMISSYKGLSKKSTSYATYDYLHKRTKLSNPSGHGVSKIAMSFINVPSLQVALNANSAINDDIDIINENNQSLIYYRLDSERLMQFLS